MKHESITSLPVSPEVERRNRMLKYTLAMGIRVLCVLSMLFLKGWWLLLPAIGAVVLPYFAVVIANVPSKAKSSNLLRPGAIERAWKRKND
ncbi:DUF3099 family protein [Microterricola gilva]|uniref:DUF3099 family protein n=1 Tax=Microterricola gilva TaxID=393267 RepID=A0A4Q8AKW6_9MICO|nr:DUF3099 domain-containing protein [Microterricola gilva]RZU65167.1 DUF3099 family protein [Microterricola gilva]